MNVEPRDLNAGACSPRRGVGPSSFGILMVYILVTLSTSTFFGEFTWEGLALILVATVLAIRLHVRPRLNGPADEHVLLGILLASVAMMIVMSIGHTLEVVRFTYEITGQSKPFARYAGYGMAIRVVMVVVFAGALTYLLPATGRWRRVGAWRFAVLLLAALAMRVLLLQAAPDPKIDVEVLQRQGAQGLLQGKNPYVLEFSSPYVRGETFSQYCYPPGTVYATVVAWLLFKEVRAAWLVCDLVGALFLFLVARRLRPGPRHVRFCELIALVFLFMPRSLYVIEKAWTEPFVVASLGALAYCLVRGKRPRLTGFLLGFWLCGKQYVVLGLPLILKLRRWRRAAWIWGLVAAALLFVPFAVWDFGALYHDIVGFFLKSEGRPDALSVYGAFKRFGYEMPWWFVAPVWLVGVGFFTWKMKRTLSAWLFATASTWLFFFMFGKQAVINYFYLIAYTLLLAVAAYPGQGNDETKSENGYPLDSSSHYL